MTEERTVLNGKNEAITNKENTKSPLSPVNTETKGEVTLDSKTGTMYL